MIEKKGPTIAAFPGGGDQYTDSFYAELTKLGATVLAGRNSLRWLRRNAGGFQYVHFHWPSYYYHTEGSIRTLVRAARFAFVLVMLRASGKRILWTAHNLYPHERSSPRFTDHAIRLLICRLAAYVVVHGSTAAAILQQHFRVPRSRLVVVDHGHFIGRYPSSVSRSEARRRLGIEDSGFVYLFLGICRPYKNLLELVRCFQLQGARRGTHLVIAGRCPEPEYRAAIEAQIQRHPEGIVFMPNHVPDDEIQIFMAAADVVVLPFAEVLTSGSAVLALSFGRPVVAPRRGYLIDLVREGCGFLYDPNSKDGLESALDTVRGGSFDAAAIRSRAAELRWDRAAACLLNAMSVRV